MLIISNGTIKSGSTWLYNILKSVTNSKFIPKTYDDPNWKNSTIQKEKLKKTLDELDYSDHNYLCKTHFCTKKERDLIVSYKNVKVLGITRDIKDAIVSYYYHLINYENYKGDFKTYYWTNGRGFANLILDYNYVWNIKHPQIFITSYKKLKTNPSLEITKIAYFLGIHITKEKINKIMKDVDFKKLKKKNAHFRKGEEGDWKNHFDNKMLLNINMIIFIRKLRYSLDQVQYKLRDWVSNKMCTFHRELM